MGYTTYITDKGYKIQLAVQLSDDGDAENGPNPYAYEMQVVKVVAPNGLILTAWGWPEQLSRNWYEDDNERVCSGRWAGVDGLTDIHGVREGLRIINIYERLGRDGVRHYLHTGFESEEEANKQDMIWEDIEMGKQWELQKATEAYKARIEQHLIEAQVKANLIKDAMA